MYISKPRFVFSLLLFLGITIPFLNASTYALNADGLDVEWQGPAFTLTNVVADDGQQYIRVQAFGYSNDGQPGQPSLPSRGHLVALPPSGDFGLEQVEVVYETVRLAHPVEPAPAPAPLQFDAAGQPLPGGWTFVRAETVYASATPVPATFAALGEAAWMRDHRLARLTFSPFRYHPAQGTLDVVRYLRVRIWWEPPVSLPATAPRADTFKDVLIDLVLNPADIDPFRAANWTQMSAEKRRLEERISFYMRRTAPASQYKILVDTQGIYALDYATLAAAGLPTGEINPAKLQLSHGGGAVAAQWEGDGDAIFESGERLLFYARPKPTRYAGHDVYWLTWGGADGLRMADQSGAPAGLPAGVAWATALAEENVEYVSLYQGRDGDHWFWNQLKLPDLNSGVYAVSLETPSVGATGELTVWFQSTTRTSVSPDHHVRLGLNGSDVGDVWWEGKTAYTATVSLSPGFLQSGNNTVGLSLPGDTGTDIEGALVDAVAITYALGAVNDDVTHFRGQDGASAYTIGGFSDGVVRVYDVTEPSAPLAVSDFTVAGGNVSVGDHGSTPAEYLILTEAQIQSPQVIMAAKTFADPIQGADYVFITHPDFETALAPLIAHRSNQGLRVLSMDVETIYDQFGDGRMDPAAIRAFLSYAYANWPAPAFQYVLLVGDGTYDPRHYRPDSSLTFLPPYLADVDPWLGETTSDNRYADLTDDILPDVRLGRLPVNTAGEVAAVVDKIIRYETDPLPGGWNGRLVFGADNPSTAGNHHADSDSEFLTYATPAYGYEGARVYLSETPGDSHLYTDAHAAQDALVNQLNQGALFYTYFGHASWHQEAVLETDGYAPLFHVDHIAQLNNAHRWPVVLHMTCFTGQYAQRASDTLDESLLRADDVGAVAVWGSSGNGVATGHRLLHRSFYQAVFDNGQSGLGAATHAALVALYADGKNDDLIETYHLFGDPALVLDMTIVDLPFSTFLPIIRLEF